MNKQQQHARIAAAKAQGQRVFVSGIQGQQTLEVGVAYHYRGHYIYGTAGNPIEPVPFSTKKGINIIGTVQHLAPRYDPNAPDLVPEPSIAALNKSRHHAWNAQKEREQQDKEEVKQALEAEQAAKDEDVTSAAQMPINARWGSQALSELSHEAPPLSYSTTLVPSQVLSRGSSRAVSRMGSRGNSHTSLPSLTVLDARSNPSDSAPYSSILFQQTSSESNVTSFVPLGDSPGLLSVPERASRVASLGLRRSSSDEAHFTFPSRTTSALPAQLHRLSSRPGSSSSLAELAAHNAHASHGGTSFTTLPGLHHSSSLAGSYGSSPSLTTLGHDYAAAHNYSNQAAQSTFGTAPSMPSVSAYAPQTFLDEHSYTPHDRALFLAASAPGSRLATATNTPYTSRPVSPTLTRSLHPVASTSRLNQLVVDNTVQRSSSPLSDLPEGTSNVKARKRGFDLCSETNSSPESATSSAYNSRNQTPTIVTSPPYSRNKPIGTGRPRRASMALNQAYNAANPVSSPKEEAVSTRMPKCALHGEGCDGVAVSETWRTQHAKETMGFKDLYPVVEGAGGRVMVDWQKLVREEKERMT
jgi:hypothetical protein